MTKSFLIDSLFWGFVLWLIGYMLGIALFFVVPPALIGWVISPIGIVITFFVLTKKIKVTSFRYYVGLAVAWTLIAILCDYFLLVKVFKPADGYYKLDVYLYYVSTYILPLIVGWRASYKKRKMKTKN